MVLGYSKEEVPILVNETTDIIFPVVISQLSKRLVLQSTQCQPNNLHPVKLCHFLSTEEQFNQLHA